MLYFEPNVYIIKMDITKVIINQNSITKHQNALDVSVLQHFSENIRIKNLFTANT